MPGRPFARYLMTFRNSTTSQAFTVLLKAAERREGDDPDLVLQQSSPLSFQADASPCLRPGEVVDTSPRPSAMRSTRREAGVT